MLRESVRAARTLEELETLGTIAQRDRACRSVGQHVLWRSGCEGWLRPRGESETSTRGIRARSPRRIGGWHGSLRVKARMIGSTTTCATYAAANSPSTNSPPRNTVFGSPGSGISFSSNGAAEGPVRQRIRQGNGFAFRQHAHRHVRMEWRHGGPSGVTEITRPQGHRDGPRGRGLWSLNGRVVPMAGIRVPLWGGASAASILLTRERASESRRRKRLAVNEV